MYPSSRRALITVAFGVLVGSLTSPVRAAEPLLKLGDKVRFSGQYRLNAYADVRSERTKFNDDNVAGARLRLRPTFDADVVDRVSTHLQFNIGHIHANQTNARFAPNGSEPLPEDQPAFAVRHAVIRAQLTPEIANETGIIPIGDRFGETLFSSAWDFQPLGTAFITKWGALDARIAGGRLQENRETLMIDDNADFVTADVDVAGFGFSSSVLSIGPSNKRLPSSSLLNVGARYLWESKALRLRTFAIGSVFRPRGATSLARATGLAAGAEGTLKFESASVGLLALYSTGDSDFRTSGAHANSFITPMSLIGHHGYWGYTGRLTVQGPTDTGIDDPVNIDGGSYSNKGLGTGLATLQLKATKELTSWWSLYAGTGGFTRTTGGIGDAVGYDTYLQSTFRIGKPLTWDLGLSHALLGTGHFAAELASGERATRSLFSAVSRLQLEW